MSKKEVNKEFEKKKAAAKEPQTEPEVTEQTEENLEKFQELEKKVENLEAELKAQKELLLRTAAEYDNYRKRTEREKAAVYSDATAEAVTKILPVEDNLERALEQKECNVEDLRKGVEMVNSQLRESLTKLGIVSMGEIGEPFNPDLHNAVSHIDDENLEENVISAVFQKGYKMGEKVVRHAMVQVAN